MGYPAPASSSSGRCWPGPARIDTTGFVAAVGQAYPGDELAAVGPTGVGGSLVASPAGEVLASAGPTRSCWSSDLDLDAVAAGPRNHRRVAQPPGIH